MVCECSREQCTQRISIDFGEYEAVREHSTHFIVAPSHREPAVERLVSRSRDYEIVEKTGIAAILAADEDPRS
jgi:hypothetical protein